MRKEIGVVGLGNMGKNIAERLHSAGYSLVLYNRTKDRYAAFKNKKNVYLSADIGDFVGRLRRSGGEAIIWLMLPSGSITNDLVSELSHTLSKGDIVIDASNALYTDSIANYKKLKGASVHYLDVGCAGGPADVLKGVSLMVGGDEKAYDKAIDVFKVVAGDGTYGYVGGSGAGQVTKLVHNGIFYGIFPVYAEGTELLLKLKDEVKGHFNVKEAMRLLAASPPINGDIMSAMAKTAGKEVGGVPEVKVSNIIKWEAERAGKVGVRFSITKSILYGYGTMSESSRRIYAAAKKLITGH